MILFGKECSSVIGAVAKFNEELSYDEMGNILTLKRKNVTTANTFLNFLEEKRSDSGLAEKVSNSNMSLD